MIFNVAYYVPIGILVINGSLIFKKSRIIYTKILVALANFWLIVYLINNYLELRIYLFSIDSIADVKTLASILFHSFLLISIVTFLYNVIIELLLKFYKNVAIDYITLFSNIICIITVYLIYDLLAFIIQGNLNNVDLRISFISTLFISTVFLAWNSMLTTALNFKKK